MSSENSKQKVFCLGFQKTGTTSLGTALEILGYSVQGYYPFREMSNDMDLTDEKLWVKAQTLIEKYDAFKDTPWPIWFKQFDRRFPNAKYIHIFRDTDRWIESVIDDFQHYPNQIHQCIYGSPYPRGNEESWIARYERHNQDVKEYFGLDKQRFISLHLESGEVNWDNICRFLEKPNPQVSWPHVNTKKQKKAKLFFWRTRNRLAKLFR